MFSQKRIVIKGAGDLATGVAARLWRSGFPVIMTEIDQPLTVRRTVSFSDGIYEGEVTVEDMTARRVQDRAEILKALDEGVIPMRADPEAKIVREIDAFAVIDAMIRLLPGAVSDEESTKSDTFPVGLLDAPYYTRPSDYRGLKVPDVLLSGHHAEIDKWREQQRLERTRKKRPDMFDRYVRGQENSNEQSK